MIEIVALLESIYEVTILHYQYRQVVVVLSEEAFIYA